MNVERWNVQPANVQRSRAERVYAWACERLYHEWAWSYDLVAWAVSGGFWPAWRRLALEYIRRDDGQVLEIGFGTGALLADLARGNRRAVGLEPSPAMHRVAARRLGWAGTAPPRVAALAQAMPFGDGAFDAMVATFPAPYIVDPSTLRECARVLRPHGRLIIAGLWVTPVNRWLRRLLPIFFGQPAPRMVRLLRERFEQAGFSCTIEERRSGWATVGISLGEPWRNHG